MLTLKLAYDVLPNRQVTIQLPPTVQPGHHDMVIVLDSVSDEGALAQTNISRVMQFAGAVSSFAYFSDRGRLFQTDRGRRFSVIVDAQGCAQARL